MMWLWRVIMTKYLKDVIMTRVRGDQLKNVYGWFVIHITENGQIAIISEGNLGPLHLKKGIIEKLYYPEQH